MNSKQWVGNDTGNSVHSSTLHVYNTLSNEAE